jgi:hypothetical protein
MLYLLMAIGCATVYHDTEPVSHDYVFEEKEDTSWVAVSLTCTEAYCPADIRGIMYWGPMGGGILNIPDTSADARNSEEKDRHQNLVVFEAKPGRYKIVGLKHLWKGEIWLNNHIYFDVSPGKVNYIGHLKQSCCLQNG